MLANRGRLRRGELALFARLLDLKPRTLRKWRAQAQADTLPVMGRPPLTKETWRAAVVPVARAWQSQGWSAGRPCVLAALKRMNISIPVTIVRELLRELKLRRRRYLAHKRAAERQHVKVHARDVLWSEDSTHLGRDAAGKAVQARAVKDVATTTSIEHSIGGAATGTDVLALLKRAKLVRGTLPLVLAMDNGPENNNELVCSYLRAERVIVLWNAPYTPEHNAWIESQHGEMKRELDASGALLLGLAGPSQVHESLSEAGGKSKTRHLEHCVSRVMRVLNTRARPSRGGRSAAQLDTLLDRAEDLVDRDRFYAAACAAIEKAVRGIANPRARRRAEREAIWCTLEELGLVTRTRGTRPASCSKAERLS